MFETLQGHRTPLFVPEAAFDMLVRRQLQKFLQPSLACVDLIYDELTKIAVSVGGADLSKFTQLRYKINDVSMNMIRDYKKVTMEQVRLSSIQRQLLQDPALTIRSSMNTPGELSDSNGNELHQHTTSRLYRCEHCADAILRAPTCAAALETDGTSRCPWNRRQ